MYFYRLNSANSLFFVLLILTLNSFVPAYATLQNISISISEGQSISINVANSISNITTPVVTIPTKPVAGTATAIACGDATIRCIQYQPDDVNFSGTDLITYTVINDAGSTETATITVFIGSYTVGNTGTAQQATSDALSDICSGNTDEALSDMCNPYNATPADSEDRRQLIEQSSPSNIGSQGTLSSEITKDVLSSISRRLSALRSVHTQTLASRNQYQRYAENTSASSAASSFSNSIRGGAASADMPSQWDWYLSGKTGGGEQNETDFEYGFDFSSQNITTGLDYKLDNKNIFGGAINYSSSDMNLNYDGGGMDITSVSLLLYGSYFASDRAYFDTIISLSSSQLSTQRRIVVSTFDATALGETDSTNLGVSLVGGYDVFLSGAFSAAVNLRLDYIDATIDHYQEDNAGAFNLAVNEQQHRSFSSALGATFSYASSASWGVAVPQLNIAWLHQFEDQAQQVDFYFVSDPLQKNYNFSSNIPDTDYFLASLGSSIVFAGGKTAFIQYETLIKKNFSSWNISGGLRVEW